MEETITNTTTNEKLRKLVSTLNDHYIHWEKFKDMQLPDPVDRVQIWEMAKAGREQGYCRQLAIGDEICKWWIGNTMEARLHQLDIGMAGGMDMTPLLIPKHEHRYRTNALLDESISSAHLAGVSVSKKAAKEMLLKKRSPRDLNEQICINIYRTLQFAASKKADTLTESLLLQFHQSLTKDTLPLKAVGKYRSNNKTDESAIDPSGNYKPVDAKLVPELMAFFLSFYNDDATPFFIHPLVKAAILHYCIVSIRPFKDGNGRMARLLAHTYLLKKGYWVAGFLSVSNIISKFGTQYRKALALAQNEGNNIGYFIHFYIQSVQMAFKSLRDFVLRISKEKSEQGAPKIPGYNERQITVLQWLKAEQEKVVTIRELRSVYGVSKETARTDLTALVEKGWLKYYHINKKTYAFVKGDGFERLLESFPGDTKK